ncbi:MAG: tyrosine--tRNA ligase, partial [Minisyncoccales bacterium]
MRINRDPGKIEEVLTRGVKEILPSKKELFLLMRKKRIRVYQGFDPSMPNLHLGNLVGILKLKQFQDLGHEVIFLIGDFTGRIGDPTGRISARKKLTKKEIIKNIKNWHEQVARFLNFSGENPAKILFNSQWLDKIRFGDLIEISSNFTVQRMLERDFFQERIKKEKRVPEYIVDSE